MMPQSTPTKVNLACGGVFVTGDGWINLDYSSADPAVKRADLLGRLPLPDDGAVLVYSSHFLEHIPRSQVPGFLAECRRILAPGGVLRLVLPDLDNLCRTYLSHRECGEHEKANFVVLEMIDQCVRHEPGGELGGFYRGLKCVPEAYPELIDFFRERTGEDLLVADRSARSMRAIGALPGLWRKVKVRIERLWAKAVLHLLPSAFRAQNVSIASVGERHHWLWDFEQLRTVLQAAGFDDIERCDASTSRFDGFPFQKLDLDADGRPRKGVESMYIEARKID